MFQMYMKHIKSLTKSEKNINDGNPNTLLVRNNPPMSPPSFKKIEETQW